MATYSRYIIGIMERNRNLLYAWGIGDIGVIWQHIGYIRKMDRKSKLLFGVQGFGV